MTHQDYKELLAANALTALDAADSRLLETHLESCAECRSELNVWQETAAALALDVRPVEPSPDVRERILAGVRAIGTRATGSELTSTGAVARAELSTPRDGRVDGQVVAFDRPRKNVWTSYESFGRIGSIAAALALVALIISLILLWQQNRATQRELASLSTQMEQTKGQLAHEREAVALLTSPGARLTELAGTNMAPGAHAMLAYNKSGHAMLMAKGLPAAPKGMAYQLWFIVGNKPMPGKVFKAASSGEGTLEDDVPAEAMNKAVFAITLEPEKGVEAPTGAIFLKSGA